MKKVIFSILILLSLASSADYGRASRGYDEIPQWTWDLGGAFGTYSNYSYSELDLGLNDHFWNYLNWRNVAWDRFGSVSVLSTAGIDSSLRFEYFQRADSGSTGFHFFAGPGVRIASNNFSGDFLEAGIIFKFGGLNLGFGVKDINYFAPPKDPLTGLTLPATDLMYFVIISGGGVL